MICGTDGCEREVHQPPEDVDVGEHDDPYFVTIPGPPVHTDDGSVECRVGTCDHHPGQGPHDQVPADLTYVACENWTPCTATVAPAAAPPWR